jgi:hypothetical protein
MKEGWNNDDYLILFDDTESEQLTVGYGLRASLPDFSVVALSGWDDFIVQDQTGKLFRVPTVPCVHKYLSEQADIPDAANLTPDERFMGKIKWFTKPIVFGGDPSSEENMIWVDIVTHQELVRWWNQKYQEVQQGGGEERR